MSDEGLCRTTYASIRSRSLHKAGTATWLQKFTPRGERSAWSKINREKEQRLIESGRMQPPGVDSATRAKANGQWDAAVQTAGRGGTTREEGVALWKVEFVQVLGVISRLVFAGVPQRGTTPAQSYSRSR